MALNTRGAIDPRWAFAFRPVVAGTMLCQGVLYRPLPDVDIEWNPYATLPQDREPGGTQPDVLYRGPARVQPNLGWRARKQNTRDETVTEHAILVQIDFRGNTINSGVMPEVHVADIFRVTQVLELDGVLVDPQILSQVFTVRSFTPSSNSWVRGMLCDSDLTKVADPVA